MKESRVGLQLSLRDDEDDGDLLFKCCFLCAQCGQLRPKESSYWKSVQAETWKSGMKGLVGRYVMERKKAVNGRITWKGCYGKTWKEMEEYENKIDCIKA